MVLVNESVRQKIKDPGFSISNTINGYKSINTAINPVLKNHNKKNHKKCSFSCHNIGCSPKILKHFKSHIDPLYYGLIDLLKKSGNYVLANIVFLVLLWPIVMFYLLIKSLDMQQEIKKLKEI